MASAIVKSLKFAGILNGRLSFSTVKKINGFNYMRYHTNQSSQRKTYATAVQKLELNEDSHEKSNQVQSKAFLNGVRSIDDCINRIDAQIRRAGRTQFKNVEELFSMITSKGTTSDVHALYLIRSCKYCCDAPPSDRIELVNQIWNKCQELGIEYDVQHYNALIDVHTANGLNFDPAQILASMEEHNIQPNRATYMLAMKKYCQDGNISGASEILEYMKEKKISIDENVFNYLIEGHIKNNDIQGAKEMLDVMKSSKLEATADTHAILACGYAAVGDKDQMMAHLNECRITDSAANHLKVIVVLATSGNEQYIDDVFALIEDPGEFYQDITNCVVELIHKNHIDVAYKIAAKSHTGDYFEGFNIFLKQLMRTNQPPSVVADFCERIFKEGYNTQIFGLVLKVAAENQHLDYCFALYKKMMDIGQHVIPQKIWPVIKEQPPKGVWKSLEKMSELGILCDFTTYFEVIYPKLGVPEPSTVFSEIKKTNQSIETALDALFVYYCSLGKIEHADRLTELYPVRVSNKLDIGGFLDLHTSLSQSALPKYYKVLKYMLLDKHNFTGRFDVQGSLLADLLVRKTRLLENLLYKFEDLKFSEQTLNICETLVRDRNPRRLPYVKRLREFNREKATVFQTEDASKEDEDKYIKHLKAQNITCRPFLIKRLHHHIQARNALRVQELLAVFDELKFQYSPLLLSNLLGMWCTAGDLEKAKSIFNKLQNECPEFKLEISKALDYTTLLLKYEKFEESYEVLQNFMKDFPNYSKNFDYNKDSVIRSVKRFSTVLSNTQNIEFIRKMQNVVGPLSKDRLKKNLVDSVLQVHLNRGDLNAAFEEFKNVALGHRVLAGLNEMYKKCIVKGETEILQKVIDLTTSCSSKSYALIQLAVAFIETFNTQRAAAVFEELGRETDPRMLEEICATLGSQNKLNELGHLLSVTKTLSHVNREILYHFALKGCVRINDCEKALALIESMKDEGLEPDAESVKDLRELLEKNNRTVPLSLLSKSEAEIISAASEATKTFMEHLHAGNAVGALKELAELKKGYIRNLSIQTLTDLVELCVQEQCTAALSTNVNAMSYIIEHVKDVLTPILQKYSEAGDIEKLKAIASFIPDFCLMNLNFNIHLCKAYISCGRYEDLLLQLEEHVDKKNKLFSVSPFEELLKLPEFEDRALNLAVKYCENNYFLPIAVVWAHNFSKENYEKADELRKNFTIPIEKVYNIVLKHIKTTENVSLAKNYVELMKSVNVRMRIKERAFGAAIDLLVFKGMYDEAVDMVVEAEKLDLQLHKYYLSTLVTLKSILEKENKPVPFNLPLSNGPTD